MWSGSNTPPQLKKQGRRTNDHSHRHSKRDYQSVNLSQFVEDQFNSNEEEEYDQEDVASNRYGAEVEGQAMSRTQTNLEEDRNYRDLPSDLHSSNQHYQSSLEGHTSSSVSSGIDDSALGHSQPSNFQGNARRKGSKTRLTNSADNRADTKPDNEGQTG